MKKTNTIKKKCFHCYNAEHINENTIYTGNDITVNKSLKFDGIPRAVFSKTHSGVLLYTYISMILEYVYLYVNNVDITLDHMFVNISYGKKESLYKNNWSNIHKLEHPHMWGSNKQQKLYEDDLRFEIDISINDFSCANIFMDIFTCFFYKNYGVRYKHGKFPIYLFIYFHLNRQPKKLICSVSKKDLDICSF